MTATTGSDSTFGRARAALIRTPATGTLPASAKARLIIEIVVTYVPALRLLRTSDLNAMVKAARDVRATPEPVDRQNERDLALRLGFIVARVLEPLPSDSRCLVRSLVLLRMLTRRSIPASLVIGVKTGPPFEAHAWIEHDGLPVLPAHDFAPRHVV